MIKRLGTQLTALLEEPGRMSLPKFAVAGGSGLFISQIIVLMMIKLCWWGFVSLLLHQQAAIRSPDIYSVIILYRTQHQTPPPSSAI